MSDKPEDIPQDVWDSAMTSAAGLRNAVIWQSNAANEAIALCLSRVIVGERERIASALDYEASVTPDSEDAVVVQDCADLVRANFSYDEAENIAARRA